MILFPRLPATAGPLPRIAGPALYRSVLARRIVLVNLVGLLVLVVGLLSFTYVRDSRVQERERALIATATLLAGVMEQHLSAPGGEFATAAAQVARLGGLESADVFLFDADSALIFPETPSRPVTEGARAGLETGLGPRLGTDFLRGLLPSALAGKVRVMTHADARGGTVFAAAIPVRHGDDVRDVLVLSSNAGEIDDLARDERRRLLKMMVVAALVSLGLSLVLASAIATPLGGLADAAEAGRIAGRRGGMRVRIPDLSHRSDEIGRLSGALRAMVATMYQRLETNEQFAADVAHELKNPLASLRSAVSTMRVMTREEHRETLLAIIEHDVRRLDRLVCDIASASRLDSELVREEEAEFDVTCTLAHLADHFRQVAQDRGIMLVTDLPSGALTLRGLEPRLAQVFLNLIANAVSFCEDGDAVRIWCRRRDGRVLIVVEDTGPGIPPASLARIFDRFYSERPSGQFGEHSGLGLSISRQIVEAHGGVIRAENIAPGEHDPESEPMGARFVVGLRA